MFLLKNFIKISKTPLQNSIFPKKIGETINNIAPLTQINRVIGANNYILSCKLTPKFNFSTLNHKENQELF